MVPGSLEVVQRHWRNYDIRAIAVARSAIASPMPWLAPETNRVVSSD